MFLKQVYRNYGSTVPGFLFEFKEGESDESDDKYCLRVILGGSKRAK